MNETIKDIPLKKLNPFPDHPFGVRDDEAMQQTVESVREYGVLVPAIARPLEDGSYELISGHRRKRACELAGLSTMPVIVRDIDTDAATIIMVDSNIQRENILPSEKAKAYKMKLEAIKRQAGRPSKDTEKDQTEKCGQVGHNLRGIKSRDLLAENADDSARQIQRYIRLTELIPEILGMVDAGKIALTPAVELSYLTGQEQQDLLETMESEDCTPSLAQAIQLKKLSQSGELNMDKIFEILREPKANQQEKISFRVEDLRKFFPKSYSVARIQERILKLLEADCRKRQLSRGER